jgi:hypothetical protein
MPSLDFWPPAGSRGLLRLVGAPGSSQPAWRLGLGAQAQSGIFCPQPIAKPLTPLLACQKRARAVGGWSPAAALPERFAATRGHEPEPSLDIWVAQRLPRAPQGRRFLGASGSCQPAWRRGALPWKRAVGSSTPTADPPPRGLKGQQVFCCCSRCQFSAGDIGWLVCPGQVWVERQRG